MIKYMLDTNICIYLIKQQPPKVLKYFKTHTVGDIGISSITLAGLRYGVSKSQHIEKNQQALDEFTAPREPVRRSVKNTVFMLYFLNCDKSCFKQNAVNEVKP